MCADEGCENCHDNAVDKSRVLESDGHGQYSSSQRSLKQMCKSLIVSKIMNKVKHIISFNFFLNSRGSLICISACKWIICVCRRTQLRILFRRRYFISGKGKESFKKENSEKAVSKNLSSNSEDIIPTLSTKY